MNHILLINIFFRNYVQNMGGGGVIDMLSPMPNHPSTSYHPPSPNPSMIYVTDGVNSMINLILNK